MGNKFTAGEDGVCKELKDLFSSVKITKYGCVEGDKYIHTPSVNVGIYASSNCDVSTSSGTAPIPFNYIKNAIDTGCVASTNPSTVKSGKFTCENNGDITYETFTNSTCDGAGNKLLLKADQTCSMGSAATASSIKVLSGASNLGEHGPLCPKKYCASSHVGSNTCSGEFARCTIVDNLACTKMCEEFVKAGHGKYYRYSVVSARLIEYSDDTCTKKKREVVVTGDGECANMEYKFASMKVVKDACVGPDLAPATPGLHFEIYKTKDCTGTKTDGHIAFNNIETHTAVGCLKTGLSTSTKISCSPEGVVYETYSTTDACNGTAEKGIFRADGGCNTNVSASDSSWKVVGGLDKIGVLCPAATTIAPVTDSVSALTLSLLSILMMMFL